MQNACLGLFLAGGSGGKKLMVKRNVSRGGSYSQCRVLYWLFDLWIRAAMQRGRTVHGGNRSVQTYGNTREDERAE